MSAHPGLEGGASPARVIPSASACVRAFVLVTSCLLAVRLPVKRFTLDRQLLGPLTKASFVTVVAAGLAALLWARFGASLGRALSRVPTVVLDVAVFSLAFAAVRSTTMAAFWGL